MLDHGDVARAAREGWMRIPTLSVRRWLLVPLTVAGLIVIGHASVQSQSGPARFSCTIDGQAFSSNAAQTFGLGRGKVTFLMPDANLLLYGNASGSTSSLPSEGFRQRILDVGPDEPLSLVFNLGSASPSDPQTVAQVTLVVQQVSKKILSALPLTARVGASSGPTLDAIVAYARVTYPGASTGQLVIEAVDLTQHSIRGSFSLTTTPGMIGKEKPLTLTNGRFDIPGIKR